MSFLGIGYSISINLELAFENELSCLSGNLQSNSVEMCDVNEDAGVYKVG